MINHTDSERAELHKIIWRIANELRGSVDGWDFKSYVLGMLFYRFISENLVGYLNERQHSGGDSEFDYSQLSDAEAEVGRVTTVDEKGFYILPSELFVNLRKRARYDINLNETLSQIFRRIEGSAIGTDSESDMKGLFADLDVNSNKLGSTVRLRNEKLVKILDAIGDLPLGREGEFSQNTIDLFGDAYEYLMTMYASAAGKSGGEFFTPQEVSELLARITVAGKTEVNKVYDPACGSGSLLLKFAKVLGRGNVRQGFFGQEVNLTTYNLCRINMFLHNINFEKFDIAHGDTLMSPAHMEDEPFEAIVSNPPYSIKWEGKNNPLLINDPRFASAGVLAPPSKADLAFTMHILSWLAVDGTAAIVEFPGVLYRGGAEQKIRQYLIDNNYVDTVIQLPPDLFFGTTIATCIIVLKKSKTDNAVLFIDASAEFVRSGNKNTLLSEHQQKILDSYTGRQDLEYFARLVEHNDIAENDYNLAISSYVEEEDTREPIDIQVLNAEIAGIVTGQAELRTKIDAIVFDLEGRWRMNKIEELIAELCPDGVESKTIDEICSINRGRVISKDFLRDHPGPYPVYSSQTANDGIFGYIDTYDYDYESITWTTDGAKAGSVFYHSRRKFSITNVCGLLRVHDHVKIIPRFLYYSLQIKAKHHVSRGMGNPKLMSTAMARIRIPVPPLEIQHEIVNILDTFSELQAELQAELEARQKQYQYYRDHLLSFNTDSATGISRIDQLIAEHCPEGVEFKALKDMALVSRGKRLTKRQLDPSGRFPVYSGGVTPMGYYGENNQSANTVTVVKYGTAGFVNYITSDFWANDVCYCIKPFERIQGKYLYYALKSRQDIIYSLAIDAIPAHLPTEVIKNFRIPVPPLEIQNEIVSILDKFDTLVNDLSIGLPAEINARRKQYEYYRDRLLTFKEAA